LRKKMRSLFFDEFNGKERNTFSECICVIIVLFIRGENWLTPSDRLEYISWKSNKNSRKSSFLWIYSKRFIKKVLCWKEKWLVKC